MKPAVHLTVTSSQHSVLIQRHIPVILTVADDPLIQ